MDSESLYATIVIVMIPKGCIFDMWQYREQAPSILCESLYTRVRKTWIVTKLIYCSRNY